MIVFFSIFKKWVLKLRLPIFCSLEVCLDLNSAYKKFEPDFEERIGALILLTVEEVGHAISTLLILVSVILC